MDGDAVEEELVEDEEVMTDADFERAMEQLREEGGEDVNELLMAMSENRIISWEEAERILGNTTNEPVKSSLPQQTRPTEPDNDTDVDWCVQRLMNNDPKLVEINLNNMKRTPIPKIKRVVEALRDNEHLEKLSLANMGLYDMDVQPLIDILEHNTTLRCVNLETNYLSGDFFSRLFKAALTNQTLEEVKAVNQGVAFSTTAEREIIDAITQNRGLTKVSLNLRLPEGRFKIEQATIRNQEIRRILRRQEAAAQAQSEAEAKAKGPPKLTTRAPKDEAGKKEKDRKASVQELARKVTAAKLAVAGAASETPNAKAGTSAPAEKSGLREKARDMEKEAAKPKEPKRTAERVLLAERLRETGVELESGVAARRAKFGEKAQKSEAKGSGGKKEAEAEGKPKKEKADKTEAKVTEKTTAPAAAAVDGSGKPKYVPSWREKLAERDAKAKELSAGGSSTKSAAEAKTATTAAKKTTTGASSNSTTSGKEKAKSGPKSPTKGAERKESKDGGTTVKKVPKKKPKDDDKMDGIEGTVKAKAEGTVAEEEGTVKAKPTATTASWRDRLNAPK